MRWTLRDSSGRSVSGNSTSCGHDDAVYHLAAGSYQLSVESLGHAIAYEMAITTVAAETFSIELPTRVGDDEPAAGAGTLEVAGSEDVYRFEVAEAGVFTLRADTCLGGDNLDWTLEDSQGRWVDYAWDWGAWACASRHGVYLKPGEYRLRVTQRAWPVHYKIDLGVAVPQTIDVTLPQVITDGAPADGAGNLEEDGAIDKYKFYEYDSSSSLQIDLSECSSSLSTIWWSLRNTSVGTVAASGDLACSPQGYQRGTVTVPDIPGAAYELQVGSVETGTYKLTLSKAPAQAFDLGTVPASVSDGVPASGAGHLETDRARDLYTFTTSDAKVPLQIVLSDCSSTLTSVTWTLKDTWTDWLAASGTGCAAAVRDDLPPGRYRLAVSGAGTGTYRLTVASVAPQTVDVTLPATISDGVPMAGAGRLETSGAKDVYDFTTIGGVLHMDLSDCTTLGDAVRYQMLDIDRGLTYPWLSVGCGSDTWDLRNGRYKLIIGDTPRTGSYKLDLSLEQRAERYDVSLPQSVSDGVPSRGSGNLENAMSEDDYSFYTDLGVLQFDFSDCSASLGGAVDYRLTQADTGDTVVSGNTCSRVSTALVQPGYYDLHVTRPGKTGTYRVALDKGPHVERFSGSLPLSVSNGAPGPGAGNLETTRSVDAYQFSMPAAGALQLDFSNCTSDYGIEYTLRNATTGATIATGGVACSGAQIPNVPAGTLELALEHRGVTMTYAFTLSVPPPPQVFDVELPLSASPGVPSAGAGNLETSGSVDVYRFSAGGTLRFETSDCALPSGFVNGRLTNETTGASVGELTWWCGETKLWNIPAGLYRLTVTQFGEVGTYKLSISVAPQEYDVTLPASISNGVPRSGAGNLETTTSEDAYSFSTASAGGLQIDLSTCSSSLATVDYKLTNVQTGATVTSGNSCSSVVVPALAAGDYRLSVRGAGKTGTYRVKLQVRPPAQTFDVSLPAVISNGVPGTGAGNLETTASTDVYRFTTATAAALQLDVSQCASSLSTVDWELVNAATGAPVAAKAATCASTTQPNVPAGSYRLTVTRNGKSGTYKLALTSVTPQVVDLSLPASIANGMPKAGAGNLETAASEDVYRFTTTATGAVLLGFSTCSSGLGTVSWQLVNETTGATAASSASSCALTTVPNVPAGSYRLAVTAPGKTGTYSLAVSSVPPQAFDVTLPASIANGVPKAGAGNVEAAASEDQYRFSTPSTGGVKLVFSTCSSSLSTVSWKLVNATTGATVASNTSSCAATTVPNVPAGSYRVTVTGVAGKTGTYKLAISRV